jgi:hypothetical protein
MRQLISGLVTVVAVMTASAAPAMACGGGLFQSSCCGQAYVEPCAQPQVYVSPAPTYSYSGCNTGCGGGWAYERLPDPVHQYYYVNQGPTYSGPGNFAPYPTYEESALSAYEGTGATATRPAAIAMATRTAAIATATHPVAMARATAIASTRCAATTDHRL